jgi:CHAT domain-containing protein
MLIARPFSRMVAATLVAAWLGGAVTTAVQPATPNGPPTKPTSADAALAKELAAADPDRQRGVLDQRSSELGPGLIQALLDEAVRQRRENDLRGALATFGLAAAVGERIGRPRDVGRALNQSAQALLNLGRLSESRETLLQARARFVEAGDEESAVRCFIGLGILSRMNGDLDGALALYDEAVKRADAAGFARVNVIAHNNRAVVYLQLDDLRRALVELEAARDAHTEEDQLLADILSNIGLVHMIQGSTRLGIDHVERAIAIQQRLGNRFGTINEYANLAPAYLVLDRRDEALAAARRAVDYADTSGARELGGRAHNQLGGVLQHIGRMDEAGAAYRRAAELAREGGDGESLARALTGTSRVLTEQGRFDAALAAASDASAAIVGWTSPRHDLAAQYARGLALQGLGRLDEATAAYTAAIEALDRWRETIAGDATTREVFFESKLEPYHAIVALLLARHRPAEALVFAERARSRVLLDVLQRGRPPIVGRMTEAERRDEAALEQRLARATTAAARGRPVTTAGSDDTPARELEQARQALEEFHTRLYARRPDLRLARGLTPIAGVDRLRTLVDADTAVVLYVVTPKRTFVFVATRPTPAGVTVEAKAIEVTADALAARITRFRERLAARDVGITAEARALHALLVAPAIPLIGARTRWVLSPDGPLWQLPFQALRAPGGQDLLDAAVLEYTPSLSAAVELRSRLATRTAQRPLDLAAFGASLSGGGVLPDVERQVRAIARLYDANRTAVFVGASAREARARTEAPRARILHIAAHGEVDDASPLYSRLLLAGDAAPTTADDDGRLEARELINYDIAADLMVLSACETGLGRIGAGEGVIGLSWAALVAGAGNVAVSLWRVDAASTGTLMTAMHQQLRARPAGNLDPALALRAAARQIRRDPRYRHPFYWAGFVVVGSGRALAP